MKVGSAEADSEPLDDPAWHALTGAHRGFAVALDRRNGSAQAYRYRADVGPFAALHNVDDPQSWRDLAELCRPGQRTALVAPSDRAVSSVPPEWTVTNVLPCVQMLAPAGGIAPDISVASPETLVALGTRDATEMVALAELTHPGPFATSTVELGGYLGVRRAGRLVAMAGRRMHLPGWVEISAVCTHPDHRRQGLSRLLIAAVESGIREQNHRAFLHVIDENASASALYHRLGFTTRAAMTFTVVRLTDD